MKRTSFALGVLVGILVAISGFLAFRHNQLADNLELKQLESDSMKKRLEVAKAPLASSPRVEAAQGN